MNYLTSLWSLRTLTSLEDIPHFAFIVYGIHTNVDFMCTGNKFHFLLLICLMSFSLPARRTEEGKGQNSPPPQVHWVLISGQHCMEIEPSGSLEKLKGIQTSNMRSDYMSDKNCQFLNWQWFLNPNSQQAWICSWPHQEEETHTEPAYLDG